MLTYNDFLEERGNIPAFLGKAINQHLQSDIYKIAKEADEYDRQKNTTIYNYVRTIFTATGSEVVDFTAANNRLACNMFHRLNTQRCLYSLGNGITFPDEGIKDKLGNDFDTQLKDIAYKALIHGICFGFWNLDKLYVFPITEFVPLWDEDNGALRAGIRFWRLSSDKPVTVVFYEEDGFTRYHSKQGSKGLDLELVEEKRPYKTIYRVSEADGAEMIGGENYGALPIKPMWGSSMHQSTLVGMQRNIDSYDLIQSGFANDLSDCAQIYWILSNCSGMTEQELARFRDRLKVQHIAVADTDESAVTPYTQEVPYQARETYLQAMKQQIYYDFGAFNSESVSAGNITATQINAAYQPMDEEADDYEYQIIKFVRQILALQGIDEVPVFKRNKISNLMEQVQMITMEAEWLDDETILSKLPNISVDEVPDILKRKGLENMERFKAEDFEDSENAQEQQEQAE